MPDCEKARYSDLQDCAGGTNMDVDPGFVGTGFISDLGPGYFKDYTAAWQPDKYKGLYVNPAIMTCQTPMYCYANDRTTIYVDGDPSTVAAIGDLFFIPDFHLRRMSDGFAFDSPLIDAGNPDPEWNDPDGTRCDLGPYGGPYARTPLPDIPTWPPPTFAPYPTPAPSPSTPEADPDPVRCPLLPSHPRRSPTYSLHLNNTSFHANAPFLLTRSTQNPGTAFNAAEIIVLDIYGDYFFWPDWRETLNGKLVPIPSGTCMTVILQFTWPQGNFGQAGGLCFWGAILNPEDG